MCHVEVNYAVSAKIISVFTLSGFSQKYCIYVEWDIRNQPTNQVYLVM